MILPVILALVALTVPDPSGDAFGDGTLTPPTAPVYADTAVFDIRAVELTAAAGGTRLSVSLGSLGSAGGDAPAFDGAAGGETGPSPGAEEGDPTPPDGDQQGDLVVEVPLSGFLPTVVDVYLVAAGPGFTETLTGPDLDFPNGTAWQYAVRISSDGAYLVTYPVTPTGSTPSGGATEAGGAAGAGQTAGAGPAPTTGEGGEADPGVGEPGPDAMPRLALPVSRRGRDLVVYIPITLADDTRVQAMSGVYDPFSPTGWRALSPAPSPWAFSGADTSRSPVIDLLAADPGSQASAIAVGVLPRQSEARAIRFTPWPYVMVIGLLLALAGLVSRSRVTLGKKGAVGALTRAPAEETAGAAMAADATAAVIPDDSAGAASAAEPDDADAPVPAEAVPADAAASDTSEGGPLGDEPDQEFGGEWEAPSEPDPWVGFEGPPPAVTADADGAGAQRLAPEPLDDEDDDDDLYDPVATAADVLAAEVAAADEAGAADQELLVDDTDELVLDTGEREAALALLLGQGAGQVAEPAEDQGVALEEPDAARSEVPDPGLEPVAEPPAGPALEQTVGATVEPPSRPASVEGAKDPFGTEAGTTFLLPIDDPSAVEDFIDELGGEESFWHPRTRSSYHRPPTLETPPEPADVAPDDAPLSGTGGSAPDEDADPA